MGTVEEGVERWLRERADPQVCDNFVAGCAERMVQIFTGLRGSDEARRDDVDLMLAVVEALWRDDVPSSQFDDLATRLERVPEFASEDVLLAVEDIHSFYAALVVRCAARYRADQLAGDAVECAHVSLTAMGQIDQNVANSALMSREYEMQRRSARASDRETTDARRAADQVESRERLLVLLERVGG